MDVTLNQWLALLLCGLLIGVAKTGIPGVGILVVPIMAGVFAAKESVGVLLGILILADSFAAVLYRYKCRYKEILIMMPATITGVVLGACLMKKIDDQTLKPLIGIIVLVLLGVRQLALILTGGNRDKIDSLSTHWIAASGFGFLAGLTSMLANAAGPVMMLYLLSMRLDKHLFVGTAAWYFFILNWLKVPFAIPLRMFTIQSLILDAATIPTIALGAALGVWLLHRIPQKVFETVIALLTAAAAVNLLFK